MQDELEVPKGMLPNRATNAAEVVALEKVQVEKARSALGISESEPLRALCLSGGGIRSASFSIGFLQALAERRLIRRFDYMSGVSGGGYALGWWSALMQRRTVGLKLEDGKSENQRLKEGLKQSEELISTFAQSDSGEPPKDPFVRRYVRAHGNYLTVRTGLASPDTWAALVTILRNLCYGLFGPGLAMVFAGIALIGAASAIAEAPRTYGAWVAISSTGLAATGWGLIASVVHGYQTDQGVHWKQLAAPWLLASACVLLAAFLLTPNDRIDVNFAELFALFFIWFMLIGDIYFVAIRLFDPGTLIARLRSAFISTLGVLGLTCIAVLYIYITPSIYSSVWFEGSMSMEEIFNVDPRRAWLLWSLLVLSHAWEWVRAFHMRRRAFANKAVAKHSGESRAEGFRNFIADSVSVMCGIALAFALPWLAPASQLSENNWVFAGLLSMLLATAAVLYSSLVIVSMGSQRRTRADGQDDTEATPDETMEREVWSQLWSKFILASFLLASALTAARWVQTLGTPQLLATVMVIIPMIALLAAAGLFTSQSQFVKLAFRASGFAAVLGTSLLALLAAELLVLKLSEVSGPFGRWLVSFCLAAVFVYTLLRNGPNTFSMHDLYRNRLVRAFLGASNEAGSVGAYGFCKQDDLFLKDLRSSEGALIRPFPIWNAAVNVTASDEVGLQERKAASFIFSPLYCGYEVPSSTRTKEKSVYERAYAATCAHGLLDAALMDGTDQRHEREPLTVGAAMATSGAAFSSNTGASTQPERALLLTLLGFRLGRWFPNPASMSKNSTPELESPKNAWTVGAAVYNDENPLWRQVPHIIREALSQCDVKANAVYITDGGHFENLGVYEMVRRRAMLIVAVDAACDPKFEFADLMNLQQKVRSDFGVEIVINGLDELRSSATKYAQRHVAVWDVIYQQGSLDHPPIVGKLIYCKSTLTGTEPADLLDYKRKVTSFPHLSTVNQWFAESTFEAYRTLGIVVGREVAKIHLDLIGDRDQALNLRL